MVEDHHLGDMELCKGVSERRMEIWKKVSLEDMLWQAIIHSHWLAMMQQTNGVCKQLMQQFRKSNLIQFSVTKCNVFHEADMF